MLLGGTAGCLVLLGLVYLVNLKHFLYAWTTDENYSHGFLVPFISLYFADQAARRGPVAIRGGALIGSFLIVGSLLGRLAMVLVPIPFLGDLAFLTGLAWFRCLWPSTLRSPLRCNCWRARSRRSSSTRRASRSSARGT
jgi:hypothetical protein